MHNVQNWSDILSKSYSKCTKIFKCVPPFYGVMQEKINSPSQDLFRSPLKFGVSTLLKNKLNFSR